MFETKGKKVIRECRKAHNMEFYMLYALSYIITMNNFRKMQWARDAGVTKSTTPLC